MLSTVEQEHHRRELEVTYDANNVEKESLLPFGNFNQFWSLFEIFDMTIILGAKLKNRGLKIVILLGTSTKSLINYLHLG